MKLVIFFSCLIVAAAASDVIDLTDSDFSSRIKTFDVTLVEFFAPWCGHCKKLAPEYEKAATLLKKADLPINLVKVDCVANTETCKEFGVSGYPTLKIFREGKLSSDYNGARNSDGIVKEMKKLAAPATKQLDTVADFEKFTSKAEPVVIGFFSSPDVSDAKIFLSLTGALRESYTFGNSYSKEVADKAGFGEGVVLFRPKHMKNVFEEATVQMTDAISQSNVDNFLKANLNGLCGHMTSDNADKFVKPLLTAFYKVDYEKDTKGTNYWRNRVMKIGKNYKDDLTLSIANGDEFGSLLSDSGLSVGDTPVVVIRDAQDKKYVMEEEFSRDGKTLEAFIKSFLAGDLKPKIKSEPVSESQGPVTVVVGENFDEIVMDENKVVLIEFYAPWCGHCKSLAPKWDELGEKMKGNDDLVIAKMDATANDSPSQFQVSGFPTIYWAPKGNKQSPTKYSFQGGREVSDFISFLEKNASTKLKSEL